MYRKAAIPAFVIAVACAALGAERAPLHNLGAPQVPDVTLPTDSDGSSLSLLQQDALLRAVSRQHQEVFKSVGPAVVGITSTVAAGAQRGEYIGTGVLVSSDGLILTSTTAVPPDAQLIRVYIQGRPTRLARVVESDKKTEALLLKIHGDDYPSVAIGDSAGLEVGDLAYTFGSPYRMVELQDRVSLSAGAISGIYYIESGDYESAYEGLVLETDAAVNPGSDGGPLVNERGELVGILSLAYSENRWLGTAVPTHLIMRQLQKLRLSARKADKRAKRAEALGPVVRTLRAHANGIAAGVVRVEVQRDVRNVHRPNRQIGMFDHQARQQDLERRLSSRLPGGASGVLLDRDGHILTSYYNITDRPKVITVEFADGSSSVAHVVGTDAGRDVAILKTVRRPPESAEPVRLAEEHEYACGQMLAVVTRTQKGGYLTLNRGIISATNRRLSTAVQTDANVSTSCSGAPAVDLDGRVIGLVAHIHHEAMWEQNCGVGFITTGPAIHEVLDRLLDGEHIEAPAPAFLGIQMAEEEHNRGILVDEIVDDSAAAEAGVRAGDVIVVLAGMQVRHWMDLVQQMMMLSAGQKIDVVVLRDGREIEMKLILGARE